MVNLYCCGREANGKGSMAHRLEDHTRLSLSFEHWQGTMQESVDHRGGFGLLNWVQASIAE
jgi:hypothetical protein